VEEDDPCALAALRGEIARGVGRQNLDDDVAQHGGTRDFPSHQRSQEENEQQEVVEGKHLRSKKLVGGLFVREYFHFVFGMHFEVQVDQEVGGLN